MIMNQHQADLNGLSGGSSLAIIGGISAISAGTVFLVAACLHWRFCARRPAALPVRHSSARFIFAKPNRVAAIALLSA